ncbi:HAMP domain-containing histidine kinase [Nocardioides islandensis]|uniref:histidine kinase n=1 Tax=Nocardioides islandensis TaxID=433663 RepID=A0A930VAV4_9ACTN|nr:HAMP domain-containing sensor histidine kinase [Nocardioides islandensis]MBF4764134.1 HAMP domain-containing histidine kinase [Nocardioides islandensis]
MTSARVPGDAWSWRHTSLIVAVVLTPVIGIGMIAADGDLFVATVDLDALIVSPAALLAAFACYATWWIDRRQGLAWATIGLAALGFQELVRGALQRVTSGPVPSIHVLAADVSAALVVVVAIALGHQVGRTLDPAAVGFGVGALVAGCRLAWFGTDPAVGLHVQRGLSSAAYVVTVALVAGLLWWGAGLTPRIGSIPPWVRQRTAFAIAAVGVAHLALFMGDGSPTARTVVVLGDVVGAVLLVTTYLALFIRVVGTARQSYSNLGDELLRARRADRKHRARMHEINATIAGITSASRLLLSTHEISAERRTTLQGMVTSELARLERLVAPPSADATSSRSTDLDATIGPLVVSHQARGRRISWAPSGHRVLANRDAVAEVINVLLDNAATHARSEAEVLVTPKGGYVQVVVHDDGPGVDRSLLGRVFDWGVRGPRSTGQGIGLNIARELARQQGGSLDLIDDRSGGATFVLDLPRDPGGPGGTGSQVEDTPLTA